MDVPKEIKDTIVDVFRQIDDRTKECELLFSGVTEMGFTNVLRYCRSIGWPIQEQPEVLDIFTETSTGSVRTSVIGSAGIEAFCRRSSIKSIASNAVSTIQKTRLHEPVLVKDYGLRINLKQETALVTGDALPDGQRMFRLKKRYRIALPGSHFALDATIVRSSTKPSRSFAASDTLLQQPRYELEVEYIGSVPVNTKHKAETLVNELFHFAAELLASMQMHISPILLSEKEKQSVQDAYLALVGKPRGGEAFVGGKPVTLERQHLMRNPVTDSIAMLELHGGNGSYAVTEKADGERHLVFVDSSERVFLINNRLDVNQFPGKLADGNWASSLFDAEVVNTSRGTQIVLLFDAYYQGGANITGQPLFAKQDEPSRYKTLLAFAQHIKPSHAPQYELRAKVYSRTGDLFADASLVLDRVLGKQMDYDIDGLIYMPIREPAKLSGTWASVYKWKPANENTIDFLVQFDGADLHQEDNGTLYRKLNLFVGFNKSQAMITSAGIEFLKNPGLQKRTAASARSKNEYVAVPFSPEDAPRDVSVCKMYVDDNRRIRCKNGDVILDDTIVEFSYDVEHKTWVPKRVRHDKTAMYHQNKSLSRAVNDSSTALSVWTNVVYPVTEDHVRGKASIQTQDVPQTVYYDRKRQRSEFHMRDMMNFHNWIKSEKLIGRRDGVLRRALFDIGCGKGGDLHKWLSAGFKTVIGVDLYPDNIANAYDGIYARMAQSALQAHRPPAYNPDNHRYAFFPFDASHVLNEKNIQQHVPSEHQELAKLIWTKKASPDVVPALKPYVGLGTKGFDMVSCQFALHYFFESMEKLDGFIKNVSDNLLPGGLFVGTCFDGQHVHRLIQRLDATECVKGQKENTTIWAIWKSYNSWDELKPGNNIGKKIHVFVESISNRKMPEYLVDFDLLHQKLQAVGIELVESQMFEETYRSLTNTGRNFHLDQAEKEYSFLNRWFIFQKKK